MIMNESRIRSEDHSDPEFTALLFRVIRLFETGEIRRKKLGLEEYARLVTLREVIRDVLEDND